jgi:RNA 2',3'-cyclic 3'-phosphodiesterase
MFVALDLPEEARSALARWRDGLVRDRHDLRPVAAAQLHVTLAFLGWQDEAEADRIGRLALDAADGVPAPLLAPGAVRGVPPRDPRLFALDLEDRGGRAGEIAARVGEALERERLFRRENRPFWAHLTLARVRKSARRVPALPADEAPAEAFPAPALTLYRSTLRPEGALYDALARRELEG